VCAVQRVCYSLQLCIVCKGSFDVQLKAVAEPLL
jgi:hypothetical protein